MYLRLLAIEDDPIIFGLICKVATETGFDCRAVGDIKKISRIYHAFQPDLIAYDLDAGEWKTPGKFAGILLISSAASQAKAQRLMRDPDLTIIAQIAKPFRITTLRRVLEKARLTLSPLSKAN